MKQRRGSKMPELGIGAGQTSCAKERDGGKSETTEPQIRGSVEHAVNKCSVVSRAVRQRAHSGRWRHGAAGEGGPEKPESRMAVRDPKEREWTVSASTGRL